MVWVAGFEPAASRFQAEISTRLSYTQTGNVRVAGVAVVRWWGRLGSNQLGARPPSGLQPEALPSVRLPRGGNSRRWRLPSSRAHHIRNWRMVKESNPCGF
jgi:hypothetical protein